MIKAIVFDCFGVLAYDGWLAYKDKYFSDSPDVLEQAVASNKRVDAGLITYDQFVSDVARLANVTEDHARSILEDNPPNERLFAYIRESLKPKYKIGMLSNAGANWLPDIFTPEQIGLFDETVLSYQLGTIKPDPVMYETIAARLGVLPEECIFTDDQPRYCEGARATGMKTVPFIDTAQTIAGIEELLGA